MKNYQKFGYDGGIFSKEELELAKKKNTPLTLDFAIPSGCRNNCFYCGYRQPTPEGLTREEIFSVIDQFREIGGKSIKILGEGEPFIRSDILEILEYIFKSGLKPVLFTCGDTIGDEKLAKQIHGLDSREIIDKLAEFNVTVMLKYEKENEDDIVDKRGFSDLRNKTLKLLKEFGFNKFYPSHLGFGIVILKANVKEIPKVYEMAIKENIYPLLCPLMPIGKVKDIKYLKRVGITGKQLAYLASELYNIAQKHGIEFVEPADFPGGKPCDISRAGFYIDGNGNALICESDDIVGNIRKNSLKELWNKISKIKDKKYGRCRWEGKCFPKREKGVIPKSYDFIIKERIKN